MEIKQIHLGCGRVTPTSWINLDGSWNAWLARYPFVRRIVGGLGLVPNDKLNISWNGNMVIHDIRKRLPFPDNYATAVYASHLLEHLYSDEAKELLRECFRILCPEGIIRLIVPDLNAIIKDYWRSSAAGVEAEENEARCPADKLCEQMGMRSRRSSKKNILYYCYSTFKDFHSHKWMYDVQSLSQRLVEAGFADISRRRYLESKISGIADVERADRILANAGICVEAGKPSVRS
jgi:predicted SAM-dependent methyltransferase